MPQDFAFGPLLFILYLNETPSMVESAMLLYADSVRTWRETTGDADSLALQEDFDVPIRWTKK